MMWGMGIDVNIFGYWVNSIIDGVDYNNGIDYSNAFII